MSDFYVGYLPSAPTAIRRRVRMLVAAIILFAIAGATLFAASQENFAQSLFDFGKPTEFSGTLALQPFPVLVADGTMKAGSTPEPPYLLVAPGKFGADSLLAGQENKHVRLRGTLIQRAEGHMIEIELASILELRPSQEPTPEKKDLGETALTGEIVDTKCFLGVMNPGEGKVHRDCAVRCLSGGIPPALATSDLGGVPRIILLLGEDGRPLPKADFLMRVGQPVSIHGRVLESQGLFYLRTSAAGIAVLP